MSMSTHVLGFRPPDERWEAMKHIWDACKVAQIEPPREVYNFFDGEEPDPQGVQVDLGAAAVKWNGDMCEGYEIDVRLLPADVHIVRVFNCW